MAEQHIREVLGSEQKVDPRVMSRPGGFNRCHGQTWVRESGAGLGVNPHHPGHEWQRLGQAELALHLSREAWELAVDMPAGVWRSERRAGTSDLGGV